MEQVDRTWEHGQLPAQPSPGHLNRIQYATASAGNDNRETEV